MAKIACCYNCAFAFLDPEHSVECYHAGILNWPACANHPESYGRVRRTPERGICPNYRPRLPAPQGESVKTIPLGDGYCAYVDAADYEWLSQWKWHLRGGYAGRWDGKRKKTVYMHREIMKPPKGMIVDHKNRNKLDDTRDNLRNATHAENMRNKGKQHGASSRFHGVSYHKARNKYLAHICCEGRAYGLGLHVEETDAARAYDRTAVALFGEFARLNFPEEWPPERRREPYAQRDAVLKELRKRRAQIRQQKAKARARRTGTTEQKTAKAKSKKSRAETQGRGGSKRKTEAKRATGHRSRATAPKESKTRDAKRTTKSPPATSPRSRAANTKGKRGRRTRSA